VQTANIIVKNPGQKIPDDFLALAAEKFPSGVGVSVVGEHEGKKILLIQKKMGKVDVGMLKSVQDKFADKKVIFFLVNTPKSADDLQPFQIITNRVEGKEDDDQVVLFIEGDGLKHNDPQDHSPEYNTVQAHLGPMLGKWYRKLADGDLTKFSNELAEDTAKEIMKNCFANRGMVAIHTAADHLHTFTEGEELRLIAPWGYASQGMGYGGAVVAPADTGTKVTGKANALKDLFGSGTAAPAEKVPDKPKEGDPITKPEVQPDKPKTQAELEAADEYEWGAPPQEIRNSHSALKQWYKQNSFSGKCPNDWKSYVKVRLKRKKSGMDKLTQLKVVEPTKVATTADLKQFHEWLETGKVKEMRASYNGEYDPVRLLKNQEELPDFAEMMGYPLETTFPWGEEELVSLGKKDIHLLAKLALGYRKPLLEYLATEPAETSPEAKPDDVKKTEPTVPIVPKQPEKKVAAGGNKFGW
jgi:hypothetical protein